MLRSGTINNICRIYIYINIMYTVKFKNEDQIKNLVTNPLNSSALIIVDCGATWCGPCKTFGKFYDNFVDNFPKTDKVIFTKLDVNDAPDFCDANGIKNVPTILFIRDGEVVDRVMGSSTNKFESAFKKNLRAQA
jgi:thioredoxin 1